MLEAAGVAVELAGTIAEDALACGASGRLGLPASVIPFELLIPRSAMFSDSGFVACSIASWWLTAISADNAVPSRSA